jgi:hypothetical protein
MPSGATAQRHREENLDHHADDGPEDAYEHLRTKKKETEGTVELAEIVGVDVGETDLVCRCRFDWRPDPVELCYDLDDDRDVARLERLCEANGLTFEQAPHLEGALVELAYTGDRWVPDVETGYVKDAGSPAETFRAEFALLVEQVATAPASVRRGVEWVRGLSTTQALIGAILVKKLLVVALVAYIVV